MRGKIRTIVEQMDEIICSGYEETLTEEHKQALTKLVSLMTVYEKAAIWKAVEKRLYLEPEEEAFIKQILGQ